MKNTEIKAIVNAAKKAERLRWAKQLREVLRTKDYSPRDIGVGLLIIAEALEDNENLLEGM